MSESPPGDKHCRLCLRKFGWLSTRYGCYSCDGTLCGDCSAFFNGDPGSTPRVCKHCAVPPLDPDYAWSQGFELTPEQREGIYAIGNCCRDPLHPLGRVVAKGCTDISHLVLRAGDDLMPFLGFQDSGPMASRGHVKHALLDLVGDVMRITREEEPEWFEDASEEYVRFVAEDAIYPRLAPIVIPFYQEQLKKETARLARVMTKLKEAPLQIFQIDAEFWLGAENSVQPKRDYLSCFFPVVEELRKVATLHSPALKLECLSSAVEMIPNVVKDWQGQFSSADLGPDTLLSILSFIIVHADMATLYADLAFVMDFANDSLIDGQGGYALATFEVCLNSMSRIAEEMEEADADCIDVSAPFVRAPTLPPKDTDGPGMNTAHRQKFYARLGLK